MHEDMQVSSKKNLCQGHLIQVEIVY